MVPSSVPSRTWNTTSGPKCLERCLWVLKSFRERRQIWSCHFTDTFEFVSGVFFHDLYPTSSSWPTLIQFTSAVIFNAHPRISSQFHRCTVAFLEELSNDFQVVNLRLGVPKEINTVEKSVRSGRRWDKKGTGATTSVFLALVGTRNHLNSIWTMIVGKGEVEVFVKCLPMLQCQKSKKKIFSLGEELFPPLSIYKRVMAG